MRFHFLGPSKSALRRGFPFGKTLVTPDSRRVFFHYVSSTNVPNRDHVEQSVILTFLRWPTSFGSP